MIRKMLVMVGVVLMLTAFSACISERSSSPVEGDITIPNALGYGSDDDGITVQFLRVENDSRCPADVQCVRAGDAIAVVSTSVDGNPAVEWRAQVEPGKVTVLHVDRFTVTLLKLRPDPPPVGGVEQDQYELQLRIEES